MSVCAHVYKYRSISGWLLSQAYLPRVSSGWAVSSGRAAECQEWEEGCRAAQGTAGTQLPAELSLCCSSFQQLLFVDWSRTERWALSGKHNGLTGKQCTQHQQSGRTWKGSRQAHFAFDSGVQPLRPEPACSAKWPLSISLLCPCQGSTGAMAQGWEGDRAVSSSAVRPHSSSHKPAKGKVLC